MNWMKYHAVSSFLKYVRYFLSAQAITRWPLVLYRSPECWGYFKTRGYWGKKSLTSSPKGNDRSPESNVPRSICPKTLCNLSPTPVMLHIKFDQDWPTGFREVWNFRHSRASNSKMSGLIRPKIELDRAFMPVLVTSNFDDDSIKNEELARREYFPIISRWDFLDAQEQLTP